MTKYSKMCNFKEYIQKFNFSPISRDIIRSNQVAFFHKSHASMSYRNVCIELLSTRIIKETNIQSEKEYSSLTIPEQGLFDRQV